MPYTKPGERKGLAACSVAAVFISFFPFNSVNYFI